MKRELIAHIRDKDDKPQPLMDHLTAVSELTGNFAKKIGLYETGRIIGLLHDYGKASELFQNYLLSAKGKINPDADSYIEPEEMKGKIDHSSSGAQLIFENLWKNGEKGKIAAQILALCIASHHSGLIDCISPEGENSFKRRMGKPDVDTHKTEATANLEEIYAVLPDMLSEQVVEQIFTKVRSLLTDNKDSQDTALFKAGLLIRFLLSCLIDADRLDSADFENPENFLIRNYGKYKPWNVLIRRLNQKISEFDHKDDRNRVDDLRRQVSQACFDFSSKEKGIYQLTVPTGGGKTLASLRFALNHAKTHKNINHIFYVIPYTSIIDQNAEEIRKILEDKDGNEHFLDRVVLEHHSNLTPEEETYRQKLLAQNWDAPVVLTTQVQFLEALFGSGTRGARRMHQLANSIIILDEIQTVPINLIQMLNVSLRFLVENCGSTVVLCTATQPPLDKIDAQHRSLTIRPDQRIIQNESELFRELERVEVYDRRKVGGWNEDEVADLAEQQLAEKGSVLIVVNTKASARNLYQAIEKKKIEGLKLFHLSTSMCPAHRRDVLETVKGMLNNEPIICVSTQLIEAGVDIDFGAVIRYLAGLDSIAQSAGRCNRHGHQHGLGNVWIVNPANENISRLKDIVIGIQQSQRVLDDFQRRPELFGNNRIGLEAMAAYYRYYYELRKDEMRYKVGTNSTAGRNDDLFNLLARNTLSVSEYYRIYQNKPDIVFPQSFQSAAREFKVINSPTRGVIVQYMKTDIQDRADNGEELVKDLCGAFDLTKEYRLLKKAQRYSVNLFQHEFCKLAEMNAIHEVQKGSGVFYLDKQYYSNDFGWRDEIVNDMELNYI